LAEGLAESQWLNLAIKPTNHIMAKNIRFNTDANDGIGAEIAMAALAVGTSLPTQPQLLLGRRSKANRAASALPNALGFWTRLLHPQCKT
jgi:hypothetical protein